MDKDTIENTDQDIIDTIKSQNRIAVNESTKMVIKKKFAGDNKSGIIIMEVDPVTHKLLIEKRKIVVDWKMCRVFDCISVLRCYKCWGYHHFAKDCKSEVKCRKCAENHFEKDCKNENNKCVNCVKMVVDYKMDGIKTDHCANDLSCECYKRVVNRAQKNINYHNNS